MRRQSEPPRAGPLLPQESRGPRLLDTGMDRFMRLQGRGLGLSRGAAGRGRAGASSEPGPGPSPPAAGLRPWSPRQRAADREKAPPAHGRLSTIGACKRVPHWDCGGCKEAVHAAPRTAFHKLEGPGRRVAARSASRARLAGRSPAVCSPTRWRCCHLSNLGREAAETFSSGWRWSCKRTKKQVEGALNTAAPPLPQVSSSKPRTQGWQNSEAQGRMTVNRADGRKAFTVSAVMGPFSRGRRGGA